jgi:hypothetical protein
MKNKIALLALCMFISAAGIEAQSLPNGCGNDKAKFEVNTTDAAPPALTPENGKALVVFIETPLSGGHLTWPTVSTRFAIDNIWVGANMNNSYFTVSVTPGDHLVCSGRQGYHAEDWADSSPLFAEAGKVYFFESKVDYYRNESDKDRAFHFKQITADQGRACLKASKLSSWTQK